MAFATAEDFATQTQWNLSAEATATVTWLLDGASEMIRQFCGRDFTDATDDVVTLYLGRDYTSESTRIRLPEFPITALGMVEVDDEEVTDFFTFFSSGILRRSAGWGDKVDVIYSHGIPDDIKIICVDIAKHAYEHPAGFPREDDPFTRSTGLVELTEGHKDALSALRVPILA